MGDRPRAVRSARRRTRRWSDHGATDRTRSRPVSRGEHDALRVGTAGSSARIAARPASALPEIIADVEKNAASYRDAKGIAVPMVAILAFGIKDRD